MKVAAIDMNVLFHVELIKSNFVVCASKYKCVLPSMETCKPRDKCAHVRLLFCLA